MAFVVAVVVKLGPSASADRNGVSGHSEDLEVFLPMHWTPWLTSEIH